ncbi:MAG: hypothetical protein OXP71_16385 [Candidatus Poribacteria bacterium]|nr:hypothetical protein [Candidatus Poribacteria bacterium]
MKSWKKPTNEMIDKALRLVKKGTGRRYFFSRLSNPLWIQPLVKRGIFQSPPKIRYFDDGYVQFPRWPELQYLKNVSCDVPDQVVNLVLGLPKVDNPSVYDDILEIALELRGEHSAKLMPKILESLELEHQVWTYQYSDLLAHWTKENQISDALELSKILVAFLPDSQERDKRKRRRENQQDLAAIATRVAATQLEPSPRIGSWEYGEILSKGVRPLAEEEPYKVACILIYAAANMIDVRTHQGDFDNDVDYSDYWCVRLDESEDDYEAPDKSLVHTLTFACHRVYEKRPDSILDLDEALRNQHRRIFKRLRQHLYAKYPSEQTKPWIRQMILDYQDYQRLEYGYEFQQMIRRACEQFGTALLTKEELRHIFDCILNGPSKDTLNQDEFRQLQLRFHRKQLKPFAPVLFGEYETYLQQLESEAQAEDEISDDDYPLIKTRGGPVSSRSPRSPDDLSKLTDEELLAYINKYEGEKPLYKGNHFIEVNIEGLSVAFQTFFTQHIIPNLKRRKFWIENREKIERPIYVRMMIVAMQTDVKSKHFDRLSAWLSFSEWVLSHPDQDLKEDYRLGKQGDESRDNPNWYNSRRAVCDFIEVCLQDDVNVPISARLQLSTLLKMLCTQYDSWLDRDKRHFLNQNDLITEGINNTRSLALDALVQFGFWVQRHDSESEVSELTAILESRFASEMGHPLTLPEYAILGRDYRLIYSLNKTWATEHKSDFFPQGNLSAWLAAFDSFVRYNRPFKALFEILRDDFDFALQHIEDFRNQDLADSKRTEILGDYLFHYYMWDMYPLKGESSLLQRFYQVTEKNRKQWANLFDCVGRNVWAIRGQLDNCLKDKLSAFYDWRFEVKEPIELQKFTYWLKAKCLDAEWRLDEYSRILDLCKADDVSISLQLEALCEMLTDHKAKVVECFAKLTHGRSDDNIYIRTEVAKTILNAGLASDDQNVHQNAQRARENLLRLGRFDLLELDD